MGEPSHSVEVTFYDHSIPNLPSGAYTLRVEQALTPDTEQTAKDKGNDVPTQPPEPASQKIIVRGPRFSLRPADIHRKFPPENGAGAYHDYLPMLVLNKRSLPWERSLTTGTCEDGPPWLALLLFTEEELQEPQSARGPSPADTSTPTSSTRHKNPTRAVTLPLDQVVCATFPQQGGTPTTGPPPGIAGPHLSLDDDEHPQKILCNAIDVRSDAFVNLVPSLADLPFLSHVRQVSTEHKEPLNTKHDGWFSVVLSNRFAIPPAGDTPDPKTGEIAQTKNIVHLVSLEGLEYLLGDDGPQQLKGKTGVRMISLASWAFACLNDDAENFGHVMCDLLSDKSVQGTELLLRLPLPGRGGIDIGTVGRTLKSLDGGHDFLELQNPTATSIPNGTELAVVSLPTATQPAQQVTHVVTSGETAKGASSIAIQEQTFVKQPIGSLIGPMDAFHNHSSAQQARESVSLGVTSSDLQRSDGSIQLQSPLRDALPANAQLQITNASGTRQTVVIAGPAAPGAQTIPIQKQNFAEECIPAGSYVGLASKYEPLQRLLDGYVALDSNLRSGEKTFAWYRGPFAPVFTDEFLNPGEPGTTDPRSAPVNASNVLVYDERTGLFDQSYAVAFQTGRALALASKPFSTQLMQWRREAHRLVDLLAEQLQRPLLRDKLEAQGIVDSDGNLTTDGVSELARLLSDNLLSSTFEEFITSEFHESVAKHVGNRAPAASVERPSPPDSCAANAKAPADLRALMRQPEIASLLQHLSGLVTIGTTTHDVSGAQQTIPLDGATEALRNGATVALVSPGEQHVWMAKTRAPLAKKDKSVCIESVDFSPRLPSGSALRIVDSTILSKQVIEWLARLALLYDVPFDNLVPDARMLPEGSIRFFYLDPNWVDSLLDGALSIGLHTSRDVLFQELMRGALHRATRDVLHEVRYGLRNVAPSPQSTQQTPARIAGFLLRSTVVSSWKGLEVKAYASSGAGTSPKEAPMQPLRLDTLGPVMLGLYLDVPVRIEFNEPSEGLVFGMEDVGEEDKGISLRFVPGAKGAQPPPTVGQRLAGDPILKLDEFTFRKQPGKNAALVVNGTKETPGLAQRFAGKLEVPSLSPASLAIQLVRVPEQILFLPQLGTEP